MWFLVNLSTSTAIDDLRHYKDQLNCSIHNFVSRVFIMSKISLFGFHVSIVLNSTSKSPPSGKEDFKPFIK